MARGKTQESIGAFGTPKGVGRVSLVAGRSGIPLFVLFLHEVSAPHARELRSLEQLEGLRQRSQDSHDRQVLKGLEPFFASGGEFAHLLALPFPTASKRLSQMLGKNGGPGRRTGLRLLHDWARSVDLLSVPQATELLDVDELQGFYTSVQEMLAIEPGVLFLADLPKNLEIDRVESFTQALQSPDVSVFHPWLLNGSQAIAPSVAIAGWIQGADHAVGIQEYAVERSLGAALQPMKQLTMAERSQLLEARTNTFLNHQGQTRVWGGYTRGDHTDIVMSLIPLRRSTLKLRQAAEEICEPFVLEAANPDLPVTVENRLLNFLSSVRALFHQDQPEPFRTEVKLVDVEGEEKIQVGLSYSLPHSLQRFSMNFVA